MPICFCCRLTCSRKARFSSLSRFSSSGVMPLLYSFRSGSAIPLVLLNGHLFVIIVLQTVILTGITSGTQSSIATPSHPSVLITAPMDGSQVSILTPVQGTAQNIPKDEELWLFIAPFNQTTYFPQHGPIKILDEKWSTAASFGGANDVGLKFRLIPVLINQTDIEAQ